VLGCAYLFLMRLVGQRWAWMDAALLLQAAAVPLVLVAAAPQALLGAATMVYNLMALEFVLTVIAFFIFAWHHRRSEFWLLGAVLLVAVALSAAEIALQNNLLPLPKIHLIHFAMPFVFLVIGLRLIQLFVQALQHAETLNLQLEQRVADKSREIEESWQQIAQLRTTEAAQAERRRIASDLHDDLGAQLLTITQASERGSHPDRIAGMARQAMEEMRLSVRGLTSDAAGADDVLADWRAEIVTRLSEAGMAAQWDAQEPPQGLVLPARMHVQLTRILREAVSNAIRHSGGTRCCVRIRFNEQRLCMEVEDDGRGLGGVRTAQGGGHGLPNIERRVRNLGGEHRFETPAGGGTLLVLHVPLAMPAPALEMP
jgi:two-component system sensor histidine kinase UhpB